MKLPLVLFSSLAALTAASVETSEHAKAISVIQKANDEVSMQLSVLNSHYRALQKRRELDGEDDLDGVTGMILMILMFSAMSGEPIDPALKGLLGGLCGDGVIAQLVEISMDCEMTFDEAGCGTKSNCAWGPSSENESEMKCTISEEAATALFGDVEPIMLACAANRDLLSCNEGTTCAWNNSTCTIDMEAYMLDVVSNQPEPNGPLLELFELYGMCAKNGEQGSCNGDCEWKKDEGTQEMKCDLSEEVMMSKFMPYYVQIASKASECEPLSEAVCTGDCAWNNEEDPAKCDISGQYTMNLMLCGNSAATHAAAAFFMASLLIMLSSMGLEFFY